MNTSTRTLTYVGSAVGLGLIALLASWSSTTEDVSGFSEVGAQFFPGFQDPVDAETLEVVAWDSDAKAPQTFGVKKTKDDKWVISSHNDYPAEAADRLAKTASSLIGIERSAVKSRDDSEWSKFGVLDPSASDAGQIDVASSDEDAESDSEDEEAENEYGTRITLRDGSSNALVDLIVGNEVKGQSGFRYVREPEDKTTYICRMNVDLSARFVDWIEEDLLKVQQNKIVKLKVDGYSVDEAAGGIRPGSVVECSKEDLKSSGSWTLTGLKEDEEFDNSPITTITSNLQGLKIVGVRRKSPGINPDLTVDPKIARDAITMLQLQSEMRRQGFYIIGDNEGKPRLTSNEGELLAGTDDGVLYTLYFGEVARGSAKDIEVGLESDESATDEKETTEAKAAAGDKSGKESEDKEGGEEAAKDESSDDDKDDVEDTADSSDEEETGSRRYVLIKVEFDESLLGAKPVAPTEPVKPEILNLPEEKKEDKKDADKKPSSEKDTAAPRKAEPKKEEAPKKEDPSEEAKEEAAPEKEDGSEEAAKDDANNKESADEASGCDPFDESEKEETDESATESKSEDSSDEKGSEDAKKSTDDEKPAADKTETAKESADKKDEAAKSDEEPAEPKKTPREIAQEEYDKAQADYKTAKTTYESDLESYDKKMADGKKTVKQLSDRFAGWYYVITADSFEKFSIERKDVVSKKEEKKEGDEAKDDGNKEASK